jgi:hypothetical protein
MAQGDSASAGSILAPVLGLAQKGLQANVERAEKGAGPGGGRTWTAALSRFWASRASWWVFLAGAAAASAFLALKAVRALISAAALVGERMARRREREKSR